MSNQIKYVLRPGIIPSKNDKDRHFIDAPTLARLYGVRMQECVIIDLNDPQVYVDSENKPVKRGYTREQLDALIWLYPRYDGNYTLPEK